MLLSAPVGVTVVVARPWAQSPRSGTLALRYTGNERSLRQPRTVSAESGRAHSGADETPGPDADSDPRPKEHFTASVNVTPPSVARLRLSARQAQAAAMYGGRAEAYDSGPGGSWHAALAAALVEDAAVCPGDVVLDLATGTGLAALEAAKRAGTGGRVVGVDASAGMLAHAAQKLLAAGAVPFLLAPSPISLAIGPPSPPIAEMLFAFPPSSGLAPITLMLANAEHVASLLPEGEQDDTLMIRG